MLLTEGSPGGMAEHGHYCGIVSLDYAPGLQSLAVVFEDGRCAVCRTPEGGLLPAEGVQLSHFICRAGSGAVCARIGASVVALATPHGSFTTHGLASENAFRTVPWVARTLPSRK